MKRDARSYNCVVPGPDDIGLRSTTHDACARDHAAARQNGGVCNVNKQMTAEAECPLALNLGAHNLVF